MTSAMNHSLPRGGRFNVHRPKSFIDDVYSEEIEKVGPADYHPQHPNLGLPNGGRFNISNAKSDIEWLVHVHKSQPGPADYDPLPLPRDGGIISRAKPKTSIEWTIYRAEQLPGPGAYEVGTVDDPRGPYGLQLPEGGRFNISQAKSELEYIEFKGAQEPGPGSYDNPRWPCPSTGQLGSFQEVIRPDHLHRDQSKPARTYSSLDVYRDGSFRQSQAERVAERSRSSMGDSEVEDRLGRRASSRVSLLEIKTAEDYKRERAAAAKTGSAEEAIDMIFDFLERSRMKVMDVFKRIDKNGNGELDVDEFRAAFQIMGLDLPRSQVVKVVDNLDQDGDRLVDIEEFITKMRQIARDRRSAAKADAAIPQWIKDADAMKPSGWQDLGWRPLPPDHEEPPPPIVYKVAPAPR